MTRNPGLVVFDLDQSNPVGRGVLENLRTLNPSTPVLVLAQQPLTQEPGTGDQPLAVLRNPVAAGVLPDAADALLRAAKTAPGSRANEEADPERFREMLRARYDTPFEFAPLHRSWGINE